jgi:hypothetical protein
LKGAIILFRKSQLFMLIGLIITKTKEKCLHCMFLLSLPTLIETFRPKKIKSVSANILEKKQGR